MKIRMNNPSAQTASNLVTSGKQRKLPKGVLTLKQIRNRVGEGWAVIKNPEHEKGMLVRGELLYHSSDRLDALEEMGKCKKDILHSSSAENVIQMLYIYYDLLWRIIFQRQDMNL